jgi:hypothetical protein
MVDYSNESPCRMGVISHQNNSKQEIFKHQADFIKSGFVQITRYWYASTKGF